MRGALSISFAVSMLVAGCAASEPPPAAQAAPAAGHDDHVCGGAGCAECVRETGCVFDRVSKLCLTSEQAEVCGGDACATSAAQCGG